MSKGGVGARDCHEVGVVVALRRIDAGIEETKGAIARGEVFAKALKILGLVVGGTHVGVFEGGGGKAKGLLVPMDGNKENIVDSAGSAPVSDEGK